MLPDRTSESAIYPPIDDYALIGDCRSAGLVSREGSLDWLCLPRFDSPSIFAAVLDAENGGRFLVRPIGEFRTERGYLANTNVLETVFRTPTGACVLRDLMEMAELPPGLVGSSSVVVDTIEGVREEAGDLIRAEHAGAFGWEDATQLEDALLWSNKPGGTIAFKSVGHALWDLAAARTAFGF